MVHTIPQQNSQHQQQEQLTLSECLLISETFFKCFNIKNCLLLFTVRYHYDQVLEMNKLGPTEAEALTWDLMTSEWRRQGNGAAGLLTSLFRCSWEDGSKSEVSCQSLISNRDSWLLFCI